MRICRCNTFITLTCPNIILTLHPFVYLFSVSVIVLSTVVSCSIGGQLWWSSFLAACRLLCAIWQWFCYKMLANKICICIYLSLHKLYVQFGLAVRALLWLFVLQWLSGFRWISLSFNSTVFNTPERLAAPLKTVCKPARK